MTGPNTLVAPRVVTPVDPYAGVWIIEDIQGIEAGVRNGSWVDTSLGVVGASLDTLALVSDPAGALLQYGISWLIEHIEPLRDALDRLAGDAAQIRAHAQTWTNVGQHMAMAAGSLSAAVQRDLAEWRGMASDAYHAWAKQQVTAIEGLAKAALTMATITEASGMLLAAVRLMVRDAIATVASRLIVYAVELLASWGLLAPLVYHQVTTLIASWTARVASWLRGLFASIRQLNTIVSRLTELVMKLREILRRLRDRVHPNTHSASGLPPKHLRDPVAEAKRVHDLGVDPARKEHLPHESETATRVEDAHGVTLERSPKPKGPDWIDPATGKTYDAVGSGMDGQYFDKQWPQLQHRIQGHLGKADFVPVDVAKFAPDQIAKVEKFIADNKLGPAVFIVGKPTP